MVEYAESQFQAIMTDLYKEINKPDDDQKNLGPNTSASWACELFCVSNFQMFDANPYKDFILSIIGIASTLGLPLVISIIIRTLVGTISLDEGKKATLSIDHTFLDMLDAGDHKMVEAYELQWWTGRKLGNIDTFEVLKASSLEKCLIHYLSQKYTIISVDASSSANSPIIPNNDADAGHIPIGPGPGPGSGHIPIASGSGIQTISRMPVGPSCHSCTKYRQLLTDVLQDINKFQSYASTMSTASKNILNISTHILICFMRQQS